MPKKKDVKIIRRLDSLGRVTLPKEIRDVLDIVFYDEIEFSTREEEMVLQRKYYKFCPNCKNDLVQHNDKFCSKCGMEL